MAQQEDRDMGDGVRGLADPVMVCVNKRRRKGTAIETLLDLEAVSLEELVGRLKAVEERLDRGRGKGGGGSGGGGGGKEIIGKLYFTEEQVMARLASRLNLNSDRSAGHGKAPAGSSKRHGSTGHGKERGKETRSGPPKAGNGQEGDDDACHYCGKFRH
ncbi:unnamed protein product [Miscanthus lutarioriparius]|uniref:Uncharacterized protein n=1 Tax=Miscanthus lutarioriparius TaxID=422564 RepID=A0A811QBR2_9POAL|nr:unnamed protein product [Miscanthus lutarioriparius]